MLTKANAEFNKNRMILNQKHETEEMKQEIDEITNKVVEKLKV